MNKLLVPRKSIVLVKKKSRGRFPGKKSEVGEKGIVWSRWYSKNYGTEKISILTNDLSVSFTSVSCVLVVDEPEDVELFKDIHERWADKNYLPVVVQVADIRLPVTSLSSSISKKPPGLLNIEKARHIKCKTLSGKELYIKKSYCHPADWENMIKGLNQNESAFCIRLEPWILEKNNII